MEWTPRWVWEIQVWFTLCWLSLSQDCDSVSRPTKAQERHNYITGIQDLKTLINWKKTSWALPTTHFPTVLNQMSSTVEEPIAFRTDSIDVQNGTLSAPPLPWICSSLIYIFRLHSSYYKNPKFVPGWWGIQRPSPAFALPSGMASAKDRVQSKPLWLPSFLVHPSSSS